MVYISCRPTSLARDLEILQARGYQVEKVCCVDMFSGTVQLSHEVCYLFQEIMVFLSVKESTEFFALFLMFMTSKAI